MGILITGAAGLVGSHLAVAYRDEDLFALKHGDLDITDAAAVREAVDRLRPHVIFNCAVIGVDDCEADPARAKRVNVDGPAHLAEAAERVGAAIVHFSSNYVFDGRGWMGCLTRSKTRRSRSMCTARRSAGSGRDVCARGGAVGWREREPDRGHSRMAQGTAPALDSHAFPRADAAVAGCARGVSLMRLLVIAPPDFSPLEMLRREAPDVTLSIGIEADDLRADAKSADAVLIAPRYGGLLTELWRELAHVRWIHTLAAGVEFLPFDLLRRSEVVVTNSRGLYADALGEFAIAAMLWFAKDLRRMSRNQDARTWEPYTVERLEGKTVGIIGYGGIGQAVGRRAAALGMRVVAIRRRQEVGEPTIDDAIAEADYLVMSVPSTPATDRLLSRERIAAMKANAVLINIGRGATIDENALVDALRERRIRGAAFDVFQVEPLPPEHPLWQLDNVLISPHTADHTADSHVRAMQFFIENLRRFRAGESLENVVDKAEQY